MMLSCDVKTRLDSQLSRRNCQTFSTGFSSGHFAGSATMLMFAGTSSLPVMCPASLIHQHHGVGTGCDRERYLGEMQGHGLGVAEGQYQPGTLPKLGADCAEDKGRFGPLVLGRRLAGPASGPAPRDLVFLAIARLVLEPYFYGSGAREGGFDLCQRGSKAPFLKASKACSFWA